MAGEVARDRATVIAADRTGQIACDVAAVITTDRAGEVTGHLAAVIAGNLSGEIARYVALAVAADGADEGSADGTGEIPAHLAGKVLPDIGGAVAAHLARQIASDIAGKVAANAPGCRQIAANHARKVAVDQSGHAAAHRAGHIVADVRALGNIALDRAVKAAADNFAAAHLVHVAVNVSRRAVVIIRIAAHAEGAVNALGDAGSKTVGALRDGAGPVVRIAVEIGVGHAANLRRLRRFGRLRRVDVVAVGVAAPWIGAVGRFAAGRIRLGSLFGLRACVRRFNPFGFSLRFVRLSGLLRVVQRCHLKLGFAGGQVAARHGGQDFLHIFIHDGFLPYGLLE